MLGHEFCGCLVWGFSPWQLCLNPGRMQDAGGKPQGSTGFFPDAQPTFLTPSPPEHAHGAPHGGEEGRSVFSQGREMYLLMEVWRLEVQDQAVRCC